MMKKAATVIVMAILVLTSVILINITIEDTEAAVIAVPKDHKTIQQAIDNATAGDTIRIYNGTYYEHVTVDKILTIIGNSTDGVFIEGSGANKDIIKVTADRVKLVALPVNYLIQNYMPLTWRFFASSVFSGLLAIYFALSEVLFG